MTVASFRRPFNFARWIDAHSHLLKPPVGNKLVFEAAGMVVMVVGGPNQRVDSTLISMTGCRPLGEQTRPDASAI